MKTDDASDTPDTTTEPVRKRAPRPAAAKEPLAWRLQRQEDGEWKPCSWHHEGQKLINFPLPVATPATLAEMWGSGKYKATLIGGGGLLVGTQTFDAIDDPERPPKPLYPNPPTRQPAPAAPPVARPKTPAEAQAEAMASLAQGGGGGITSTLGLLTMWQQMDQSNRLLAQQEADARVARFAADSERQQDRERSFMATVMKQQETFFGALLAARTGVAIPAQPTDHDEEDDDDDEDPEDKDPLTRAAEAIFKVVPPEQFAAFVAGKLGVAT